MNLEEISKSFSTSIIESEEVYNSCLAVLSMDIFDEFNECESCKMDRRLILKLSKKGAEKIMQRMIESNYELIKNKNHVKLLGS